MHSVAVNRIVCNFPCHVHIEGYFDRTCVTRAPAYDRQYRIGCRDGQHTVRVRRVTVGTRRRGVIHLLDRPAVRRVLKLNRRALLQGEGYFPNVVAIGVRHRVTVTTPVVPCTVHLGRREALGYFVHVHLEGHIRVLDTAVVKTAESYIGGLVVPP